ncbi:hypothetical protein OSB04_014961 [Centaurea solstitialis]|uniref:F-box domain-containing protein n=1 Tax=Centaurea solstitialis TaxID=347529 RepID=A0AA38T9A2_9ASTR|nr:hypothetical protein OSB04_014961 [Centaurea solstitialis]
MNFDIQVEILKRFPVKSLIRFRSVCKAWKSKIDTSPFIADHNNVSHDRSEHLMIRYEVETMTESEEVKYVCYVDDDSFPQIKFAPPVPPILLSFHGSCIIGSSCGLVCLGGSVPQPDNSKTHMVVLWNPSIRKSVAIVVPNDESPSLFPFVGFGVCPETKDPMLLKISSYNDVENPCQVMVFTLSSREWRCLSSNQLPRKLLEFNSYSQAVIGRLLYCLAFDGESYLIWSFDFSTDEFGEVSLPDSLHKPYLYISKLMESLVLIDYDRGYTTAIQVCDVWMMMEDGQFTKLFTVKNASVVRILGFNKTGEPVVKFKIPADLNSALLGVYEPGSEHIKDLGICRTGFCFSMCSYNESLLLLDQDDGCIEINLSQLNGNGNIGFEMIIPLVHLVFAETASLAIL